MKSCQMVELIWVESRGAHQQMPGMGGVDTLKIDCAMKQTLFRETVSTE